VVPLTTCTVPLFGLDVPSPVSVQLEPVTQPEPPLYDTAAKSSDAVGADGVVASHSIEKLLPTPRLGMVIVSHVPGQMSVVSTLTSGTLPVLDTTTRKVALPPGAGFCGLGSRVLVTAMPGVETVTVVHAKALSGMFAESSAVTLTTSCLVVVRLSSRGWVTVVSPAAVSTSGVEELTVRVQV